MKAKKAEKLLKALYKVDRKLQLAEAKLWKQINKLEIELAK